MLNEEKIKLMTKLALYEQGEGKESIKSNKYYKKDYVGVMMINTAITITLAYLLCIFLWAIYKIDYLVDSTAELDIPALGRKLLLIYIVVFVVYMLVSYMVYSIKYLKMQEDNLEYYDDLKELYMIYRREEKNKKYEKNRTADRLGGFDSDDEDFNI